MRRKMLPLCAALAVLLVAVGGATAADAPGTTISSDTGGDSDGGDVGICVVGVDSPCNGPEAENATTEPTHPTPHNDSERLGERSTHPTPHNDSERLSERSTHPTPHNDSERSTHPTPHDDSTAIGDESEADGTDDDAGICLVGADSPCNGADDATGGERIGSGDGEGEQVWIPEDQAHDGEIDDRFIGTDPLSLLESVLSVLASR